VFRSVDQLQAISAERLTDRSVSPIVKGRMRKHFNSGHSMRAGYESCAAAKDIPSYRIREHTQHKSPAALEGYIRAAQQRTKRGLKDRSLSRSGVCRQDGKRRIH